MKTVSLTCDKCQNTFERPAKHHKQNIKRGRKNSFCSERCRDDYYISATMITCKRCQIKFKGHSSRKFCSISCSALFNNAARPRKPEAPKAPKAPKPPQEYPDTIGPRTKEDLFEKSKNWQSARSAICKHARKIIRKHNPQPMCYVCKYDKHTDVCHKKPVSSFSDKSIISEINDISNLVSLCKNHHWEMDNGFLSLW